MYRRILIPVDGSRTASRGLDHAIKLAAEQHARVRILNVIDDSVIVPAVYAAPVGDVSDVIDSLRRSGKKAVNAAVKRAARRGVDAEMVQVETGLRRVSDAIVEHARKWGADLIVMGTHGRRGVNRLLLGSDAERVLREAPVPILLVRPPRERKTAGAARRAKGAKPSRKSAVTGY